MIWTFCGEVLKHTTLPSSSYLYSAHWAATRRPVSAPAEKRTRKRILAPVINFRSRHKELTRIPAVSSQSAVPRKMPSLACRQNCGSGSRRSQLSADSSSPFYCMQETVLVLKFSCRYYGATGCLNLSVSTASAGDAKNHNMKHIVHITQTASATGLVIASHLLFQTLFPGASGMFFACQSPVLYIQQRHHE
jgi:hypothetical protein